MKVTALIPIKLNSKRTPGKNIKKFYDGTPLLTFTLNTLLKVKELNHIYVFCSDEKICEFLPEGISFLKRPEYLDRDEATPQDIMKEFIDKIDSDIYLVSHVTSPFVKSKRYSECIQAVAEGKYDSAFTAEKIQRLLWTQGKPLNFDAGNIPRTQDLEPVYSEVSAAYVFKKEVFIQYKRRIGKRPYICEVEGTECVDIDYPIDFKIADALYEKGLVELL